MFQIAIDLNYMYYNDLPTDTFIQRLKKARYIKGLNQYELASLTGLSRSCINDLECGYRTNITKSTIDKLITVLDKNILFK